jgi:hypothetical protein
MEEEKKFKGIRPQGTVTPVETFVVAPNYQPYLGVTVTKDTDIDDITEDGTIHQTIKGTKFITEITRETDKNDIKIKENTKLDIDLPEGTILVYSPGEGYIIPSVPVKTLDQVRQDLELLKDNEGKSL